MELQRLQFQQDNEKQMNNQIQGLMDQIVALQDANRKMHNEQVGEKGQRPQVSDATYNQMQMHQISNVFYNMMNILGQKNKDERIVALSNDLR